MSSSKHNTYIIAEDVHAATDAVEILKDFNISDDNIGTVSRDRQLDVADLPQADLTDKSQLPESVRRGALLGSSSGLLAGLLMTTFPIAGVTVGGTALLAMTAGGAALGSWSAGMIGISENSALVQEFETALDQEKTIVFAKIPDNQIVDVDKRLSTLSNNRITFGRLKNE
jgi:hypothetical protein